jgi:hypothetical protein
MVDKFSDRALINDSLTVDDKYPNGVEASPLMEFLDGEHIHPDIRDEGADIFASLFELAVNVDQNVPSGAEKTTALRKLVEAQDAIARALKTKAFEE